MSKKQGKQIIAKCKTTKLDDLHKWEQAIKLANLDDNGKGTLKASKLPPYLQPNNGMTWERTAERYFKIDKYGVGAGTVYEFDGFVSEPNTYPVPPSVKASLRGKPCVVLGTHASIEIDHKHDYSLYNDTKFNNDTNNYQPLTRSANSKKREEKRKREETGVKFNNRLVGCAFTTARWTLKDTPNKFTATDPYDGVFWSDPFETYRQDRRLFADYYLRFSKEIKNLTYDKFESEIIPSINNLIAKDFNIQDTEKVVKKVMADRKD